VTSALRWSSLGAAGLVAAAAVSVTRPFTWPSEVAVSIGLAGMLAIVALQWWSSPPPAALARQNVPPPFDPDGRRWGLRWAPWVVVLVAAAGWELYCYLSAPRSAHPTLSVVLNSIDATHVGHGASFIAWLVLGWYLVTR
jgi:hypothetical protein